MVGIGGLSSVFGWVKKRGDGDETWTPHGEDGVVGDVCDECITEMCWKIFGQTRWIEESLQLASKTNLFATLFLSNNTLKPFAPASKHSVLNTPASPFHPVLNPHSSTTQPSTLQPSTMILKETQGHTRMRDPKHFPIS